MNKIEKFFDNTIEEVIDRASLEKKLASGKQLRVKLGADPTRPDLHLGHAVTLRKLAQLQKMGHKVIFLIGDYTTKIGDPSGRNSTRPVLDDKEIKNNSNTYFKQVGKILDIKKTEIRYNSEWYKKFSFNDLLQLAGKFSVAQILERDDFQKRFKDNLPIGLHELLYPLMQAYDSVVLRADVEFGGSDQKFNMLAARDLQKKMGQEPQDVVMFKLLLGLDGHEKMSKSLDNYIGITENYKIMFGKVMSIPDSMIINYFELAAGASQEEVDEVKGALESGQNPRDIKALLARKIIELYHGKDEAEEASKEFFNVYSKKELPSDIPKVKLTGNFGAVLLLVNLSACASNSEARRLIEQGGLKVDGARITDPTATIAVAPGMIIQVGKHKFYKIV